MAIAALGESLIDFTPVVENGRTTGFQLHPGGSPYNVAVAIARLGHPSAFAGRVSTDVFGRILLENLRMNGVDTSRVRVGAEPTTLAFVAIEAGEPSFSFRAAETADTRIAAADLDPADFRDLEALHVGSISLTYEPAATSILGLVRLLRGRVPISFDPNVRASLIRNEPTYRARMRELLATSDLVKVSERDRRELGAFDPRALVDGESGPAAVIVTDGASGSTLYRRGSTLHMPAARSRVVDTVGAGDAFMAGLLVGAAERGGLSRVDLARLDKGGWRELLRFAGIAAALACERAGAEPPTRAAVESRLAVAGVSP